MAATLRWCCSGGDRKAKPSDQCDYYPTLGSADQPAQKYILPITSLPPKSSPAMRRFVIISDTHELHYRIHLPPGDFLLHCGDILVSDRFTPSIFSTRKITEFLKWYGTQPHTHKLCIAGNHDEQFEMLGATKIKQFASQYCVDYLCDETFHVGGFNFYGSPRSLPNSKLSPNGAFQASWTWDLQPPTWSERQNAPIDILLTHQPPLDKQTINFVNLVSPTMAHFCGHFHDVHGIDYLDRGSSGGIGNFLSGFLPPNFLSASGGGNLSSSSLPVVNAAMVHGSFARERLFNPIVVDMPLPTHGMICPSVPGSPSSSASASTTREAFSK